MPFSRNVHLHAEGSIVSLSQAEVEGTGAATMRVTHVALRSSLWGADAGAAMVSVGLAGEMRADRRDLRLFI